MSLDAAVRPIARLLLLYIGLSAVTGAACAGTTGPVTLPDTQYIPLHWSAVDGWADDDHAAAFATFLNSCRAHPGRRSGSAEMMAVRAALHAVCRRARAAGPLDEQRARQFFEGNFRPVQISQLGRTRGFVTGYYEPIFEGSRVPTAEFTAPLYRRPPDLVVSGRRGLGEASPAKGVQVGRQVGGKIVPYYTRGEIEDGALAGRHLEICWLRSNIDVLFAQIEGSARIRLQDGSQLRVNYDSYNGWPYTAVGRVLIARGIMTRDQVSMQSIRAWLQAHPDRADDIIRQDKSYVFFKVVDLSANDEPVGSEGVPLVPGRSIAIDHSLHVYGTPFFIEAALPLSDAKRTTRFRRLMIGQDTGSAIVGAARADIYFGSGADAERVAGRIKNSADFVMLLPRELDPVKAGRNLPLPRRRPTAAHAMPAPGQRS